MYFKNHCYLKIGQWRGLSTAEGGLDSAQVTGIQSLLPVQNLVGSLSDKYSAAPQICRSTFSQNVDARLE